MLEEIFDKCISKMSISLSQKSKESVLKEISAWLKPSIKGEGPVITKDGSITLVNPQYGEAYHSLTAGAISECLMKFVEPSRIVQKAQSKKKIRILDIGFGLGYNLAVAIERIRSVNSRTEIEILSFEKLLSENIPLLPEPYKRYHKLLLDGFPEFCKDGISFKLLLGDARQKVGECRGFDADAVFHDAFSPYRNPELWTYEFLKEIKEAIATDGFWVSYTSSLPVRKALKLLGFGLNDSPNVGRKRGGTLASLTIKDDLNFEDIRKINSSPYAIPFRDETLNTEPLEILVNYRLWVELIKVAQGGIEPPTPRFSAGCSTN